MSDETQGPLPAIVDGATSELFERTFAEGMAMVEQTAAYLDGPGREESKALPRKVALAYAGESMRLTTRLMQVVSWLLVQRAVREGEMTPEEAAKEKYRLGNKDICRGRPMLAAELLPPQLQALMASSERLYERVSRLDDMMYESRDAKARPPVADQFGRLAAVFAPSEEQG